MSRKARRLTAILIGVVGTVCTVVYATIITLTPEDLYLPGTQLGAIDVNIIEPSQHCAVCHSGVDEATDPYGSWSGSLMGQAGRDPLFFAQMTLANQDVANAGQYCLRCHVPNAWISGHAAVPDGSTLDHYDADGVSCHFCHSMVDPIYRPGVSPPQDEAVLAGLPGGPPQHYGNAMYVIDPIGLRRGPREPTYALHDAVRASFQSTSAFCGTCHEVGNIAVTRQPDGAYRYNALGAPTPDTNPDHQFPLERTYSEWKLSAFANGGVDMGGRFGGAGATVVSTCQDCHMPRAPGRNSPFGPHRPDMRTHQFAGAAAQVLDLIAHVYSEDPDVDLAAIARGRAASVSMLQRAATLDLSQHGQDLLVRVTNQTGHKLPTGHIEGRRIWINVQFLDAQDQVLAEHGRYDHVTADLDADSTTVYEMHVGLSPYAAGVTGLPAGPTSSMALADTIVKDNRIPPRGFQNAAFEAAGAPVVGASYADGQHWDERAFPIPTGAVRAVVTLNYQNTPKEYIEHLRDANTTNQWGQILYNAWAATGRGSPIKMAQDNLDLTPSCIADFNRSGAVSLQDIFDFLAAWFANDLGADLDGSGSVSVEDIFHFLAAWFSGC